MPPDKEDRQTAALFLFLCNIFLSCPGRVTQADTNLITQYFEYAKRYFVLRPGEANEEDEKEEIQSEQR